MTDDLEKRCARLERRLQLVTFVALGGIAVGGAGIALAMRSPKPPTEIVLHDQGITVRLGATGLLIADDKSGAKTALGLGLFAMYNGRLHTNLMLMDEDGRAMGTFAMGSDETGGEIQMAVHGGRDGHVGTSSLDVRGGAVGGGFHTVALSAGNEGQPDKDPGTTQIEIRAGKDQVVTIPAAPAPAVPPTP